MPGALSWIFVSARIDVRGDGRAAVGFGLVTASSPIYRQHSLGVNVNLWAGLGILAFGLSMLWLARRATR
jgi:hypothetical protein